MKITHESDLLKSIDIYTKQYKLMPSKLKGSFVDLYPVSNFCNFTNFLGSEVFVTPLGMIKLELDSDAKEPYLE